MDPLFDLTGRRVLLVGAAGEIGRGLTEALAARGARLAVGDLSAPAVAGTHFAGAVDLRDEASVRAFTAEAATALGGLDALVNAAGVLRIAKADAMEAETFRATLDINLSGAFLIARAARQHMTGGAQLHLASVSSFVTNPGYAAYAASKAGLSHLVRVLALEWARHGIRVNALAPSMLADGMAAPFLTDDRFEEKVIGEIPLRRFCTVADLVGPTVMLLSDAGRYITGQTLPVDGGRTLV